MGGRRVTTHRHRRCTAVNPGKHGPLDWRVTFNGEAPTHSEAVFMVGFLLLAEDRYNGRNDIGRGILLHFLERVGTRHEPDGILDVVAKCEAVK